LFGQIYIFVLLLDKFLVAGGFSIYTQLLIHIELAVLF
jgi:hypothetical protein